jgi:hypothetical protein
MHPEELQKAEDHCRLRNNQLRNVRVVISKGMPKKKLKRFHEVILPVYIARWYEAKLIYANVAEAHSVKPDPSIV